MVRRKLPGFRGLGEGGEEGRQRRRAVIELTNIARRIDQRLRYTDTRIIDYGTNVVIDMPHEDIPVISVEISL